MAASSIFSSSSNFPFVLLNFLGLIPVAFATFHPSSVASTQLDFWSKNVLNSMPESLLSKLSPLSKQDADYFASLVSKQPLSSEAKFCSMANLACTAIQNNPFVTADVTRLAYGITTTRHPSLKAIPNFYFRLSILKKGTKVQLPNLDTQIPRAFLPYQIASKISTTSSTDLQILFPESFTSSEEKNTIEHSIFYCSSSDLKGEIKSSCPNSLESMIEFSKKALGEKQLIALTSEITKGSQKQLEIGNMEQLYDGKVVSCHDVFFPFATYLCHLLSSSHLYAVDFVESTTKAPVNRILAVCHMDTSKFPADYAAFKVLKSSPGRGEVCHWFPKGDLAWMGSGGKKF